MTSADQPMMPMAASLRTAPPLSDALAPLGQPTPPPPSMISAGMPPGAPPMPPAPPQAPAAPQGPAWTVRPQADGSSVYVIPSPDGDPSKDIVIGMNPAPKLPKSLQPGAQQAPMGVPLAMQSPMQ